MSSIRLFSINILNETLKIVLNQYSINWLIKLPKLFCYPLIYIIYIIYIINDKISVYYFRSEYLRDTLSTSSLLRYGSIKIKPVHCYMFIKKKLLSSPLTGCIGLSISFLSLNKNYGTLKFCSGLFPFWQTTLSQNVWVFNFFCYLFRV
jgi:hypothetical protein